MDVLMYVSYWIRKSIFGVFLYMLYIRVVYANVTVLITEA